MKTLKLWGSITSLVLSFLLTTQFVYGGTVNSEQKAGSETNDYKVIVKWWGLDWTEGVHYINFNALVPNRSFIDYDLPKEHDRCNAACTERADEHYVTVGPDRNRFDFRSQDHPGMRQGYRYP